MYWMESVPLHVCYRLNSINYRVECGPKYLPMNKKEKNSATIQANKFYIIFIQKKELSIVLNFFEEQTFNLTKCKFSNYQDALNYIENVNNIIVLKNIKKEMAFLQENQPEIWTTLAKHKLYCFDNYLKYNLCLPLFIQGKISKRYRIPTIDEYIEKKKIALHLSFVSPWKKQRFFFKSIVTEMMTKISPFMKEFPYQIDSSNLSPFLVYLICCGIETHNICCILINYNSKRNFEKNKWNENIVSFVHDQYLKNPKPFDFFLLETPVENIQQGKFIMISPILSE